jgi:outer membrane immunogenic protein
MKFLTLVAASAAALVATSASASDLAGFRLEAIGGWDQVGVAGGNESGFLYGAGIGYDVPLGETLAIGADAEFAGSTIDAADIDGSVSAGRDIYVGGRITGKVADNLAFVGKAGYTNARLDYNIVGFGSGNVDLDGFRLGAGLQYLIGNGGYVGAEYRYSNYEQDFTRNQIVATFGYRF